MAGKKAGSGKTKTGSHSSPSSKTGRAVTARTKTAGKTVKNKKGAEVKAVRPPKPPSVRPRQSKVSVRAAERHQNDALDTLLLFVKTYEKL
jgi:hypothetical protein